MPLRFLTAGSLPSILKDKTVINIIIAGKIKRWRQKLDKTDEMPLKYNITSAMLMHNYYYPIYRNCIIWRYKNMKPFQKQCPMAEDCRLGNEVL